MNKTLLAIALFGLAAGETSAQQIGRVARVEPVRYEKRDGRLKILSYVKLSETPARKAVLQLGDEPLAVEAGSTGDSLLVWLPMIGKSDVLTLRSGRKVLSSKAVEAPIPDVLTLGMRLEELHEVERKWIRENLPGCDDRTANNVDVPGRTMQMPQILAKSGIRNLFVSRMREGLYDWYSPDGSSVLTYTPGNYGWATLMWKFFEKDAVTAFERLHPRSRLWSDYFRSRHIPPHYGSPTTSSICASGVSTSARYSSAVEHFRRGSSTSASSTMRFHSSMC